MHIDSIGQLQNSLDIEVLLDEITRISVFER